MSLIRIFYKVVLWPQPLLATRKGVLYPVFRKYAFIGFQATETRKGILKALYRRRFVMFAETSVRGGGFLSGTVKVGSIPASRLVRLYEAKSGVLLSSTVSSLSGDYRFDGLRVGVEYTVVSLDHERIYNDVAETRLQAI